MYCKIKQKNNWLLVQDKESKLWFSGYLLNLSLASFQRQVVNYLKDLNFNKMEFAKWLRQIDGCFAFVLQYDECTIAAVDKVRSIPLFYLKKNKDYTISNDSSCLKSMIQGNENSIKNHQVSLEIAMSGYSLGGRTLYSDIVQLTAGEFIFSCKGELDSHYYYTYSPWKVIEHGRGSLVNQLSEVVLSSIQSLIDSSDGRQIVIPLSSGKDSRLIASALKYLGAKDVVCFCYGLPNNFEEKISQAVAEKLGYKWFSVHTLPKLQKSYFLSHEFNKYMINSDTFGATPIILDLFAIHLIHQKGIISPDAIIVNGNTGDYLSGGHVSDKNNFANYEKSINNLHSLDWDHFLNKNYSLWKILRNDDNDNKIIDSFQQTIAERSLDIEMYNNNIHGIYELIEYLGRQSKYIVNMQRSYEFFEYEWRMPLWSNCMLDFWEGVSFDDKLNQKLYKNMLHKNNWGGVWSDIPINEKQINSLWVRYLRNAFKIIVGPLGKPTWHQFERNVFQYYLDPTANTRIVPYHKVLFDMRGQRHRVSWQTESYLKLHGYKNISNV